MELVSIVFDEDIAYEVASGSSSALEVILPEFLDESVWERLMVIKELTYPLPIIVAFSPTWLEVGLETVLTRLAASFVSGVSLKKSFNNPCLFQINRAHNLGLSIIHN